MYLKALVFVLFPAATMAHNGGHDGSDARLERWSTRATEADLRFPCDLSNVGFPSQASELPQPNGTLKFVAVGRGTQNYTCADSKADTVPVLFGAIADLYDASCIAAHSPDLLDRTTDLVLDYPYHPDCGSPVPLHLLGHHYFENTTTPAFNLDTGPDKQCGIALTSKKAAMDAPPGSVVGPFNRGYGATSWLYLATIYGTVGGYTEVYRLNTAGGLAPATCAGQPAALQIQYSAQYLFYI